MRGKQNNPADIARAMKMAPVHFVAFDVLHLDGNDIRPQPWFDRRMILDGLAALWGDGELKPWTTSPWSMDLVTFAAAVREQGMEGIIAKRLRSTYRSGRFSDWVKMKNVHSITCVAVGYEPGEGARTHFGAMLLALVGPDGPVPIGRVGTGFTNREIDDLKHDLDKGVMPVVEIEVLNVTRDGNLRMPSYKGRRDPELSYMDARLSQLDDIPRS